MIYTADMIGKRDHDCVNGRKWYLRHLVDRYGSGNCVDVLRHFKEVAKTRYPRKLYTENWCSFCWSDMPETTYAEIADVLNEAVRRCESCQL